MHSKSVATSSRFLATLIASFWFNTAQLRAQSTVEAGFAILESVDLPTEFDCVTPLAFTDGTLRSALVWSPEKPIIAFLTVDSVFATSPIRLAYLPVPPMTISVGRQEDGAPMMILVDHGSKGISIFTQLVGDTLRPSSSFSLPYQIDRLVLADITADRREDILVFQKNTPGILSFINKGSGVFTAGPLIAPENPVGALASGHLNDDQVLDLVLYDWVKSELHFLYGVGRGRFFDQTTLPVMGEIKEIALVDMNADSYADLLLWMAKPSEVAILLGDGLGDFHKDVKSGIPLPTRRLYPADLNNDGWNELVCFSPQVSLQLLHRASDGRFETLAEYSVARSTDVLLADVDGDRLKDLLLVNPVDYEIVLMSHAEKRRELSDSLVLVTGLGPGSILSSDFDGDSFGDLAILNSGSNTLSIWLNREQRLEQTSYSIPPGASSMSLSTVTDSTALFVLSHSTSRSVSFLTINRNSHTTIAAVVPHVGNLEFIASEYSSTGGVRFYCYGLPDDEGPSLVLFEQIGPRTFIEQSLRLVPDTLLGATVTDLTNDGFLDIVYVYRNAQTNAFELAVSLGDSTATFGSKIFSYEFKETSVQRSFVWDMDFNNDGHRDVVIAFPSVARLMKVALGNGDGTLQEPVTIAEGARLDLRSQLQIVDLDTDGKVDIVFNESAAMAICWLRGRGDGTFHPLETILPSYGVSHFSIVDLNRDGVNDFALAYAEKGVVKIVSGAILPYGRLQHDR